ncbi:MAG: PQQ-binding-like beta-propeller repeat protein, partial [Abditibacteriales bacterium]|nr:PQQ-binding-like beta-propeller repeat protein [Abditibacteriales bacterium]
PGAMGDLKRHLLCVHREDGKVLWQREIGSDTEEHPYEGYVQRHGYASSTPASDGERVFVFCGAQGVFAFALDGRLLWRA